MFSNANACFMNRVQSASQCFPGRKGLVGHDMKQEVKRLVEK